MALRVIFLILIVAIANQIGGVSVPTLADCAVEFVNETSTDDDSRISSECDALLSLESSKFYDDIQNLIRNGVNVDHLENSFFEAQETCIMDTLRQFNASNLYIKGVAYKHSQKVRPHTNNGYHDRRTSEQILILYSLQVCEPRSFYKRNAERIFTMNSRTTNEQANCLLNHLNKENYADEHYQFSDTVAPIGESDLSNCDAIVKTFERKYYNVLDRARNFALFNLHPAEAIKCRAKNDKRLISNMLLLSILERLKFTDQQVEIEKERFFDIARETALSFFKCSSLYD